jgi:hypothetical protein
MFFNLINWRKKKETRRNIMNLLRPDKTVQEALDKLDKGMIIKVDI